LTKIGYHPLADLTPPQQVLDESTAASSGGFDGIFIPDHFHPWSETDGTPFAWTLLAAVAERTRAVQVGTAVTCPSFRYNPAIVAQAFATLGAVYEGRVFLGLGTGEALNEVPTGNAWPKGGERLARLAESIDVIRALWKGGHVSHQGGFYRLEKARLYTLPKNPVPIYVSGFGPKATELAGSAGDGWFTGTLPEDYYTGVLFPALERGLKKSGREQGKFERIAELLISYDEDRTKAVESCRKIAGAMSPAVQKGDIYDPREITAEAEKLDSKFIEERMLIYDDAEGIISKIESLGRLGFTWVEVASLSPDNAKLLELFRKKILPYLREQLKD
jgi:coenzyme F420-dependent glucose-6-phosphate dehydrogenase